MRSILLRKRRLTNYTLAGVGLTSVSPDELAKVATRACIEKKASTTRGRYHPKCVVHALLAADGEGQRRLEPARKGM